METTHLDHGVGALSADSEALTTCCCESASEEEGSASMACRPSPSDCLKRSTLPESVKVWPSSPNLCKTRNLGIQREKKRAPPFKIWGEAPNHILYFNVFLANPGHFSFDFPRIVFLVYVHGRVIRRQQRGPWTV
jgi:hypothetical protein